MDPVHGGIQFFSHEATVIDHPLFQRLRFIVQNDVTSLVFPGATHTRFQHSIGAMHIAGKFMKSIFRAYLGDPQNARRSPIAPEEEDAIRYAYFAIRLAALLHDTGHFPFSHQFESAVPVQGFFSDPEIAAALWAGQRWQRYYKKLPTRLKHEHYSVRVAHEVLKGVQAVAAEDVLGIMETTSCDPTPRFNKGAKQILGLLLRDESVFANISEEEVGHGFRDFLRTIISGELDIDKMDYLLRDSFFSGVKYGAYNLDHLLNTLRIGFSSEPYWVGVAITEKGIGAFEDFVHSRFQLYQYMYSHKTVVGFKWLLKKAMHEVMQNTATKLEVQRALTQMNSLQWFTDMFFWEQFRTVASREPLSASARLLNRSALEYLQTGEDFTKFRKTETAKQLRDALRRQSSCQESDVIYFESPIKFSKVARPTFENIRVLAKEPITNRRTLHEIKEKSHFFEKFHDLEIVHFYIEPKLRAPTKEPKISSRKLLQAINRTTRSGGSAKDRRKSRRHGSKTKRRT
jgi:deoxynucleoside triphosphate triphosphohydrolase SAMHD1